LYTKLVVGEKYQLGNYFFLQFLFQYATLILIPQVDTNIIFVYYIISNEIFRLWIIIPFSKWYYSIQLKCFNCIAISNNGGESIENLSKYMGNVDNGSIYF